MGSPQNQRQPGGPHDPSSARAAAIWPILLLGLLLLIFYAQGLGQAGRLTEVSFTAFRQWVREGKVAKVEITKERIVGELSEAAPDGKSKYFATTWLGGDIETDLLAFLEDHGVEVKYRAPSQFQAMLYLFVLLVAMFGAFMLIMRRLNPAERAMAFGKSQARQYVERDTRKTFDDVAGIDEPKAELLEIVEYLRTPEKFRRLGGRIPKGVLLVGAPGTGKTLLAKAVAGEARVPFFSMSGSDFVELFVGVGASRVRDLFRQAEAQSPCIVFIDELDALGKARGASLIGGGHDEREQTLNQLLVEMDGFDSNLSVIVMAATNRPEILDPALLRPGRFDRRIFIPPPDINGREAILRVHARGIRIDPNLDLRRVAARTPGFVGADLANVVNEAALLAARRGGDAVTFADMDEAIDRVSIGLERRSHVMSDEEKRITAYHEAGHALAAVYTPHANPVHKVSIIPRGWAGGFTQLITEDDRRLLSQSRLVASLVTALGGRVAERLVFGELSTGAADDIRRVTELARAMVTELGMSSELGPLHYEPGPRSDWAGLPVPGAREISEETARRIDAEIRRLVDDAEARATDLMNEHRDALERVAERLIEVEVLDQEELYGLLGLPVPAPPERHQVEEPPEIPAPREDDTEG